MTKFKHRLSINFTKIEKRKIINPYTHIKKFGIPWANLQKKKKKPPFQNRKQRGEKSKFLRNVQEQLSTNPKKPRILQRCLFYSKPNQASQSLKFLVNFQPNRKVSFLKDFQIRKVIVFNSMSAFKLFITGWGCQLRLVGLWCWDLQFIFTYLGILRFGSLDQVVWV